MKQQSMEPKGSESPAVSETKIELRVVADASETESETSDETEPLITQGCSFDRETGTIIIDTRKLFVRLSAKKFIYIDQSEIKQLKMN